MFKTTQTSLNRHVSQHFQISENHSHWRGILFHSLISKNGYSKKMFKTTQTSLNRHMSQHFQISENHSHYSFPFIDIKEWLFKKISIQVHHQACV